MTDFTVPSTVPGRTLHVFRCVPDGEVRAVLQLSHGMVEFIDRYKPLAEYLAARGILVTGNDHLGHGGSIRTRADYGYFAEPDGNRAVLDDLHAMTVLTKQLYPGVPYFLLGHSMGSFYARQYLCEWGRELDGAIILGTGFQPKALVAFARTVCRVLAVFFGWQHRSRLVAELSFLGYNKGLRSLTLTGNNFNTLNIRGVNDAYQKTLLQDINLSNNQLTAVTLNDMGTIHNLNLSNNQLTELSLKDADNMETLDLSNNQLTEVNANYCTLMTDFNIANNNISSITMPSELSLRRFHCENNSLSFANLPLLPNIEEYVYAPQNIITIPVKSPGVDLQDHNINGQTVYTWKNSDGTTLTEGTDYLIVDGMTRFLEPIIGNSVYCEMTNELFPGLTLTTTKVQAAEMPKNKIASFTTLADGTATMILRAKEPTIICIDWKGAGMAVETYSVSDDILTTEIKTYANSNCAIYSYDDNCPLYVLNITGAKLADVDLSNMKNLVLAAVINAGIDAIKLPDTNTLTELKLDYNNFTSIDLSRYAAQLGLLSMNNNQLTAFDATGMDNLFSLSLANNALSSVKLNAPNIWNVELSGNQLESIDLTNLPNLYQLFLSNNRLKTIDLSKNTGLRILHIDYNRFTYSTLPIPNALYGSYQYGNQERIDIVPDANGIVDLASEATVDGTPSTFRWFVGDPWYDENTGELTGEELYVDEEYNVKDGKTTFHKPITDVVCAILNDKFPNLTILTNPVDITSTLGIDGVSAGNEIEVSATDRWITVKAATPTEAAVYTAGGALVGKTKVNGTASVKVPSAGVYVVRSNGTATKIAVD